MPLFPRVSGICRDHFTPSLRSQCRPSYQATRQPGTHENQTTPTKTTTTTEGNPAPVHIRTFYHLSTLLVAVITAHSGQGKGGDASGRVSMLPSQGRRGYINTYTHLNTKKMAAGKLFRATCRPSVGDIRHLSVTGHGRSCVWPD